MNFLFCVIQAHECNLQDSTVQDQRTDSIAKFLVVIFSYASLRKLRVSSPFHICDIFS